MVTLNNADNALKSFYLEALTDTLNNKANAFLAKIEKTSKNVVGKDVKVLVKTSYNGGISAGTEDGALPTAGANQYMEIVSPLKNLYGTIEISDKALRASANNEGAFVNLLNDEMQSLVQSATFNFSRMLFGTTDGLLAEVLTMNNDNFALNTVAYIVEGMRLDAYNREGVLIAEGLVVTAVDYESRNITCNGDVDNMEDDALLYMHGSKGNEISGLTDIFECENLYGVDRSNRVMQPYQMENVGEISEMKIQKAIDAIEEKSGAKINLIVCSWDVRRAVIAHFNKYKTMLPTMEVEGGFKAISFNGIPIVVDRACPAGTMYLLNTDDFKLCQLCDWQWLEAEDGKILKQVPGKAVYTATLVKYAELICERPYGQGRLRGIREVEE